MADEQVFLGDSILEIHVLLRITKAKGSADYGDSPAAGVDGGLVNDRVDALCQAGEYGEVIFDEMPHKFARPRLPFVGWFSGAHDRNTF